MSTATALRALARPLDDPAGLGRALDALLDARAEPPALLGLGEPTHGIAAFPLLRNEILGHLVERGYRSIVLETDFFAASIVDDYVSGSETEIDTVLAAGFSHGFGAVPGNRELLDQLRDHNAGRAPQDRIRCYGFDAPLEFAGAPSPRHALFSVADHLPAALRPEPLGDLDALLGADEDWSNPAAMFEPSASVGDSDRARALRIVADDLASTLRRAAPTLRPADPAGYDHAVAHARTALGLLRYHAAMARDTPDRIVTLLSLRAEMMAENLLAILAREQRRGPSLVFAHNVHLRRAQARMPVDGQEASWDGAGALVARTLGERYVFVAADGSPACDPATLQGVLAGATTRRALFPAPELRAALPTTIGADAPIVPGHLPLAPAELACADAVVFIADTDVRQQRYW
ncbi:erythromycin esterase family protein [Actinoalloteichus sp. GBA129-24]|uniref:erythromycin esterase family protein n=1 Tax=Actinoalloteichus sp. GBA129-24 TaxID=1612551 RepID=UPI0009508450|nr:erythromycin esterase family protein [Actinoalloteichus sp. GBA129-24]APU22028.1 erythromycin esterase-like enzyme [Actinoalloteichus sp. GBA129-24]